MITGDDLGPAGLGVTSRVAVAMLWLLLALLAVTTISVSEVTSGATYNPSLETWPMLADQMTAESMLLVTVAVNCCREPATSIPVPGERLIETGCN